MEGAQRTHRPVDLVWGLALSFDVVIDDFDLGTWSKCEGLVVNFEVIPYHDGMADEFSLVQGRTTYSDITLSRPVTPASKEVSAWLSALRRVPMKGTGMIALHDAERVPVMTWELFGVLPVKWQGPTLEVSSNQVAMETLVLRHEGFLS